MGQALLTVSVPNDRVNICLLSEKTGQIVEPYSLKDAKESKQWPYWEEAIDKELANLSKMGTWEITEKPPDRQLIGSKWVFKLKRHPDGSIDKYKARLVAQGFSQKPGIDFDLIYAPVLRYDTLRTFLTMVAAFDLELHSMDVTGAYLYGKLDESKPIFMKMAPGQDQTSTGLRNPCYRLRRTLYGLKQSGYEWNKVFDEYIRSLGFNPLPSEPCLYFKETASGPIFIALYVDDILIACKNLTEITALKEKLNSKFKMEDKGPASSILGMLIIRDRQKKTITLKHSGYIRELVHEYDLESNFAMLTPMRSNLKLSKNDCPSNEEEEKVMKSVPYQRTIGQLIHLMVTSRPESAFAIGQLARFTSNPGPEHWKAVIHLLLYLKGTIDQGVILGGEGYETKQKLIASLRIYSDSDWASNEDSRKSTTGYAVMLAGGMIMWGSKCQKSVSLSSMEAEYIAIGSAVKEAIWIRRIMNEMLNLQIPSVPIYVVTDSQGAIELANHNSKAPATKHIALRYHFIRDHLNKETICLKHIPGNTNIADIFTKPLPRVAFEKYTNAIIST